MDSKNREWVIYALVDPRNSQVRYVGFTVDLKQRLRDHCKKSELDRNYYKCRWIKALKELGFSPVMIVLEKGIGDSWQRAEKKWIKHYRDLGAKLTNKTDGGQGAIGRKHSETAKKKMRDSRCGTRPSEKCLLSAIKAIKGKKRPKSWCDNLSANTKGIPKTESHKKKLREASTGKKASNETRKKMSESQKKRWEQRKQNNDRK